MTPDRVTVPRLWPGSTIVCIATGPSLVEEDVAFVCGRARVIAINDAVRLAPWADILYSSDHRWFRHYDGWPSFQGMRYGVVPRRLRTRLGEVARRLNWPRDIRVLQNTGERGLELNPMALRTGGNSGYAAINLAVHLGGARIVLLGYDMALREKAHFFGDHPPRIREAQPPFPMFRKNFTTIVAPLRELGIDVINCSRETALTCFPRAALKTVFASCEAAA